MKLLKLAWFAAVALINVGCTPYQPYNHTDVGNELMGGYDDERTNQNTAIVRFNANSLTSSQQVKNFLLYRCAEVTLNNGYNYFIITSTSLSPIVDKVKMRASYNGYNVYPPRDYDSYHRTLNYVSSQYSVTDTQGGNQNGVCRNCGPHSAVAVIKMFEGQKPEGVPNAYDANDIIAHIGPQAYQ